MSIVALQVREDYALIAGDGVYRSRNWRGRWIYV